MPAYLYQRRILQYYATLHPPHPLHEESKNILLTIYSDKSYVCKLSCGPSNP